VAVAGLVLKRDGEPGSACAAGAPVWLGKHQPKDANGIVAVAAPPTPSAAPEGSSSYAPPERSADPVDRLTLRCTDGCGLCVGVAARPAAAAALEAASQAVLVECTQASVFSATNNTV
jgi:hypothetical protein